MFIFLLFLSQLYAQEVLSPVEVIEEEDSVLRSSPLPLERIGQATLESSAWLQNSLDSIASAQVVQDGGMGGRSSVFIRGSESSHTLFLLQGFRLNDPSSTGRAFDTGQTLNLGIREVIIRSGPSPVLHGSDALGGVIELLPWKGEESSSGVIQAGGGSFGTRSSGVSAHWRADNHKGTVSYQYSKTDGFSRLNDHYNATEKDQAEAQQLMSSSSHKLTDRLSTETVLYHQRSTTDLDGSRVDNKDHSAQNSSLLGERLYYRYGQNEIKLQWGYTRYQRQSITDFYGTKTDTRYTGEGQEGQLVYRYHNEHTDVRTGVTYQKEWFRDSSINPSVEMYGAFARWEEKLMTPFSVWGGIRGEYHQKFAGYMTGETGAKYQLNSSGTLFTQLSQGFKAPSLYQLHAPSYPGYPIGNSELNPERNVSWESGYKWNSNYQWEITFFRNDFKNIVNYTTANGYQNDGGLLVQGLQTSILLPEQNFGQSGAQVLWQNFSNTNQRPLRRAVFSGQLTHQYSPTDQWSVRGRLRFKGDRADTNADSQRVNLAGYELLDLAAEYRPFERWTVSLMANNLLDRDYEEIHAFNVAGRNFYAQLLYHWQ